MGRFEYTMVVWPPMGDGVQTVAELNRLGAEGWEAVGLTSRAVQTPMPGMGAAAVPEVVTLLKRPLPG